MTVDRLGTSPIVQELVNIAMRVLHHDAAEDDKETVHERKYLAIKFTRVIRKIVAKRQDGPAAKPEPGYSAVYAAALYPELVTIARAHGYALAVHGSLQRDFDLVAVPWTDEATEPQALIDAITSEFAIQVVDRPGDKPHGRRAWSIAIGHGHCAIDLSFMPRLMDEKPQIWIGADKSGAVVAFLEQEDGSFAPASEQDGTWQHWVRLCDSQGVTPGELLRVTVDR